MSLFKDPRVPLALISSLALSVALTPLVRTVARRLGLVAKPKEDRWHQWPTALLGGPAIVLSSVAAFLLAGGLKPSPLFLGWLGGALVISILGVLDDIIHLRPVSKLIAQIVAALIPISLGLSIPVFHPLASFWISLFWIVGITNAFNLLDNMDGLAAGIGAIAAAVLCIHALRAGNASLAVAAAAVFGSALGFLVYNFQPASIFMGDGGSLFLGFSLGTLSLMDIGGRPLVSLSIIAVPLFVLAVPIFDTTLVTILRLANRRSIAQGGRDHSSHRLVSLGLSERRAVLTLYTLSLGAGLLSLILPHFRASLVVLIVLAATLLVYYFGAYLGSVKIYRTDEQALEQARSGGVFVLDTFVGHKRRILDVTIDLVIIAISYLGAYLLRYEGTLSNINVRLIVQSLPILVTVRLLSFFAVGVYRSLPGVFSLHDFLTIGKGVLVSSAVFVTELVLVARFQDYSRAVMVIDGVLTLSGITFARIAVGSFREVFRSLAEPQGRRVLIVGAGSLGEAAARLLKTDENGQYRIVGFLDDSPEKIGRRLHGFPVLGSLDAAEDLIESEEVEILVFASSKLERAKRAKLEDIGRRLSVETREIQLT